MRSPLSIQARSFLFIGLLTAFSSLALIWGVRSVLSERILAMQEDRARGLLRLANLAIENYSDRLIDVQTRSLADLKDDLRDRGELALSVAREFKVVLPLPQARKAFLDWLGGIDGVRGRHALAYSLDLTGLVHPDPGMIGRVWTGYLDPRGKDALAFMRDLVLAHGHGFDSFDWTGRRDSPRKHVASFHLERDMGLVLALAEDIEELDRDITAEKAALLEGLKREFLSIGSGASGYIFVLDHAGAVVLHPFLAPGQEGAFVNEATGRSLGLDLLDAARTGRPAIFSWRPPQSGGALTETVGFIGEANPLHWHPCLAVAASELAGPVQALIRRIMLIVAGVLVLSLAVAWILVRRESAPLAALARLVQGFDPRVPAQSGTAREELKSLETQAGQEVGAVAQSLSGMLAVLEEAYGELTQAVQAKERAVQALALANQELESQVLARTRELALANSELKAKVRELECAQEALLLAKSGAETANRAKSMFLANMSHEIRTPLGAIVGMIDVLGSAVRDPALEVPVRLMAEAGQTLSRIVDDILDFTKIEAGKHAPTITDFDPAEPAQSVLGLFGVQARDKGLTLELALAPDLPAVVSTDFGWVRQILTNLVSNAIKFTGEGGVFLEVASQATGPCSARLTYLVRDTGCGIPPERSAELFQPFHQLDQSYSKRHQGTGLGLAISRRLAEKLEGELTFASIPGQGSIFALTIPCQCPDVVLALLEPEEGAAHTGPHIGLAGRRILVVEDHTLFGLSMEQWLQAMGAVTGRVESGEAALDLLAREPFDAVLMDIQMPGQNGFDTTSAIRAGAGGCLCPDIPVVALTAYAEPRDRIRAMAAGMNEYLTKPVALDRLLAVLTLLCARSGGE